MTKTGKTYVIAEAGVNHNGDIALAKQLIDVAVEAKADAVKFQTFDASALVTKTTPKAKYQVKNTGLDDGQHAMLAKLELSNEAHLELFKYCKQKEIAFMSTAFDVQSLAFLSQFDMPFIKIPSGEIRNALLLWHAARVGKPLIISSGMATLGDIDFALAFIQYSRSNTTPPSSEQEIMQYRATALNAGEKLNDVTLLHCTSEYPTPLHQANLKSMAQLAATFDIDVGFSDHTLSVVTPSAAVALGAVCIEKHFTLSREMEGPDHLCSLEPKELCDMISMIRDTEMSLGRTVKFPQPNEFDTQKIARQRIVAKHEISEGALFTEENLTTARSPIGICASEYWRFIGQTASRNYIAMEPVCQFKSQ